MVNNAEVEVIVYLSPPNSDYIVLSSRKDFSSIAGNIVNILNYLKIQGYFVKSFYYGNRNYVAIGYKTSVTNKSRGQKADYVYMFIFKLSDFLKYSIDLNKLINKIEDYYKLYNMFKSRKPEIKSVHIDEIRAEDEIDTRLFKSLNSGRVGYILYANNFEEALNRFKELYKNIWLRILFDFLIVENYGGTLLADTIIINYGSRGQDKLPEFSDTDLKSRYRSVEDLCKSLQEHIQKYIQKAVYGQDPCTVVDYVENYREIIRKYIDILINEPIYINEINNIIVEIRKTPINKNIIGQVNELCNKLLSKSQDLQHIPNLRNLLGDLQEIFKETLPKDSYDELIETMEYAKNIPLCEPLKTALDKIVREKLNRENIFNTLHNIIEKVPQGDLTDRDKIIIDYALSNFSLDDFIDLIIKSRYDEAHKSFKDFIDKYEQLKNLCSSIKELESLSKRDARIKKHAEAFKNIRKHCDNLDEKIRNEVKEKMKLGFSIL
ncbi:MAG: hypothetical protein LM582_08490 [Desulfurococcaceae archaeon]|nr:hypothetical protein [Desulfurococcaceae archaeon]